MKEFLGKRFRSTLTRVIWKMLVLGPCLGMAESESLDENSTLNISQMFPRHTPMLEIHTKFLP